MRKRSRNQKRLNAPTKKIYLRKFYEPISSRFDFTRDFINDYSRAFGRRQFFTQPFILRRISARGVSDISHVVSSTSRSVPVTQYSLNNAVIRTVREKCHARKERADRARRRAFFRSGKKHPAPARRIHERCV